MSPELERRAGGGGDQGQAALELALVLPLLALVVFGLLQGILLAVDATRVAGAAREAARAAAVGRDDAGVRAAAARGGGGLDSGRLEVDMPPLPAAPGTEVRVVVRYQSTFFLPGLSALGLVAPVLSAAAAMAAE